MLCMCPFFVLPFYPTDHFECLNNSIYTNTRICVCEEKNSHSWPQTKPKSKIIAQNDFINIDDPSIEYGMSMWILCDTVCMIKWLGWSEVAAQKHKTKKNVKGCMDVEKFYSKHERKNQKFLSMSFHSLSYSLKHPLF